jgi:hypothetical protein
MAAARASPASRQRRAGRPRAQVTNDEDGLRGCWFAGAVAARAPGAALVAYAELEDDGAPGEPLREWFPLPPGAAGARGGPGGPRLPDDGHARHRGAGFQLRPQPPAQACRRRDTLP